VASLNFTPKCFRSTVDAVAISSDPAVVEGLRRLHAADCEGKTMPASLSERLIVGPERARRQLGGLIESARSSIRVIDSKLSDPVLTRLLDARRRDGLAIETYLTKRLGGWRSHGKLMLIDNEIAVVGSVALTALSLDFRREVALVVHQPAAVATLAQMFDTVAAALREDAATRPGSGGAPC
jgi:phosphatidylserine/phosphatidylglycerophosphate/cardiolipin synthase-like enzyme